MNLCGYDSTAGTLWGESGNYLFLAQYEAIEDGEANTIRIYGRTLGNNGNARVAVYENVEAPLIGDAANIVNNRSANYVYMHRHQADATGLLTALRIHLTQWGGYPRTNVMVAIYSDSAGEPDALLGQQSGNWPVTGEFTAIGWNTIPLHAPVNITQGTYYWLAFISDQPEVNGGSVTVPRRYKAISFSGYSWPETAGSGYSSSTSVGVALVGVTIVPGEMICQNDESWPVLGGQWNDIEIPAIDIMTGTKYWIGLISDTTMACIPIAGYYPNKLVKSTAYKSYHFPVSIDVTAGYITEPGYPMLVYLTTLDRTPKAIRYIPPVITGYVITEGEAGFISLSKESASEPRIHGLIALGNGNEAVTIDSALPGGFFRIYEQYEVEHGFSDEDGKLSDQAQEKFDSRQDDAQYEVKTARPIDLMPGDEISLVAAGCDAIALNISKLSASSDAITRLELGPKEIGYIDIEDVRSGIPMGVKDKNFRESHESITASDTAHVMDPKHFYSDISVLTYKYQCILGHRSSATSEPGVGATWTTYWTQLAQDADIGTARIRDWVGGRDYESVIDDDGIDAYCYNAPNDAYDASEDEDDPLHAILTFAIPPGILSEKIIPRVTLALSINLVDIAVAWVTGTVYAVGFYVIHIPEDSDEDAEDYMVAKIYRCISSHTASSTTEPGVGDSWESRWVLLDETLDLDLGRCGIKTIVDDLIVPGLSFPSTVIGSSNSLPEVDITDYINAGKSTDVQVFVMLRDEYSTEHTEYTAHPSYTASGTMKFYSRGSVVDNS